MTYASPVIALVAGALAFAAAPAAEGPNDAQIAHIAYTAGSLDVGAAKQALQKSHNPAVREFASEMVRDHEAVNDKALALVKALNVTPEDNSTSQALTKAANDTMARLAKLDGAEFDKAYVENEAAFHDSVNSALRSTLIPSADNAQLKALLETGLALFTEHQKHAVNLAAELKD